MKVSITKLASGAVRFDYDNRSPQFLNNATDAETQECVIGSSNAPGVQVQYGGGKIAFKYADILNINGEPKPPTLAETVLLLGSSVFNFGGGNGTGGVATTDASQMVTGTLPDGRLSGNIARVPGITTAKALNFDFPDSVIEIQVIGDLPTDNTDTRTPVDVVLAFYKNTQLLFKCKASMAIQGQSSANAPKKGYEADFFNAAGEALLIKWGKCHPVDGVNFKGFYTDPTHARDISAGRVWHRIRTSRPFPSSFIADFVNDQSSANAKFQYYDDALFYPEGFPMRMSVGGEYHGLYTWRMKKKRENYRLDSKNNANIFLDSDTNTGLNFSQFVPGQWDLKSPKLTGYETAGSIPNTTVLASIDRFFNWMGGCIGGSINMRTTYTEYMNLDSFIDILITAELLHSVDLNNNNTELMTWDALRWSICIYDQDLTLGFDGVAAGVKSAAEHQVLNAPMWAKIKEVFASEIKTRYTELRTTGVVTMNALQEIYSIIPRTIPTDYYVENLTKWGWPGTNAVSEHWYTSLRDMLDFLQKKLSYLDGIYWNNNPGSGGGEEPGTPSNGALTAQDITGIDVSLAPDRYTSTEKNAADNITPLVFADYLPANTDGYIELCTNSGDTGVEFDSANVYFGFAESTQLINPANMTLNIKVGVFPDRQTGVHKLLIKDNDYFFNSAVGNDAEAAARGFAGVDSRRIRIARVGSVFTVLHSGDFGVTYVTLYTIQNYNYTGKLYVIAGLIDGGFPGGSELVLPKGGGLNK